VQGTRYTSAPFSNARLTVWLREALKVVEDTTVLLLPDSMVWSVRMVGSFSVV
jgi:hypothetical protein